MTISTSFKIFYREKLLKEHINAQSFQVYDRQTTGTREEMTAALSAWDQHVFLTRSVSNRPQLVHHMKHIPMHTPMNPTGQNTTWALSGHHGAQAQTVAIIAKDNEPFHLSSFRVPSFKALSKCATELAVLAAAPPSPVAVAAPRPPATDKEEEPVPAVGTTRAVYQGDTYEGLNCIVLPHHLAVAFMDAQTHTAAYWCMVACRTILELDADIKEKDPATKKTAENDEDDEDELYDNPGEGPAAKALSHIPQILWAMAKQQERANEAISGGDNERKKCIEAVSLDPLTDGPEFQWGDAIHGIDLAGIHTKSPAGGSGSSGGPPPGGRLSSMTVEEFASAIAKGIASNPSTNTTKKGHKKWTPCHTQMVLFATEKTAHNFVHPETNKPYGNRVAIQQTDHYMSVCNASSLTTAGQINHTLLKHKLKCDFNLPTVCLAALREGAGILWDRPDDTPGAFSLFLCTPLRYDQQGQDQEVLMAYRLAEETGRGFSEAQIKKLCNLSHTAPMQGDIFGPTLRNGDGVLQGYLGGRSEVREKSTRDWIKHFRENSETYEDLGQNYPYSGQSLIPSSSTVACKLLPQLHECEQHCRCRQFGPRQL
jgi:hypothetical protein